MKNLDQIRAALALETAKKTTKQDVNKLPALILANGLLATLAFACEKNDRGEYKRPCMAAVMDGVSNHLAKPEIGIAPGVSSAETLLQFLSKENSHTLQCATAEALAFIAYVKRFAEKEGETS